MSSTSEKIKERLTIADVVSSYIKLERAGKNFKAQCPFHAEKTPSFFVSPERDSYYCFGCNAGGDIFSFVQEYEGLDFLGALRVLAEKARVPLTYDHGHDVSSHAKETLYTLMNQATDLFAHQCEQNKEATAYLRDRGVDAKTQKVFRIGLAPQEWHFIEESLASKFKREDIYTAGLLKRKEGGGYYDTFRSRIMFPVNDLSGRPVAFSGRIFNAEDSAKYLNSPETPLFKKSTLLYGFDKAKQSMRSHDFCILVEGAFDLVLAHQIGFTNTVAVMGTALTHEHVNRLRRFTNRIVIALDADTAGVASAIRSAQIALAQGMDVKIAQLPDAMDPADAIRMDPAIWKKSIRDAQALIPFLLQRVDKHVEEKYVHKSAHERQHALLQGITETVLSSLIHVANALEREQYIELIARHVGGSVASVQEELHKVVAKSNNNQETNTRFNIMTTISTSSRPDRLRRQLAGIFLWHTSRMLTHPDDKLQALQAEFESTVGHTVETMIPPEEQSSAIFEAEVAYADSSILVEHVQEMLGLLREEQLRETFASVMYQLKKAEEDDDSKKVVELLAQCDKISKELESLKKQ